VNALAKLHNFCIDQGNPPQADGNIARDDSQSTAVDTFNMMTKEEGFISLDVVNEEVIPTGLLGAGSHFKDVPQDSRTRRGGNYSGFLP
jgi:hypothetical protein